MSRNACGYFVKAIKGLGYVCVSLTVRKSDLFNSKIVRVRAFYLFGQTDVTNIFKGRMMVSGKETIKK